MKGGLTSRFGAALLALSALASSASATWSICVVNRRTGEVAVASATCIQMTDLTKGLPVVRVGEGVGAIQSSGWAPGLVIMFDEFPDRTPQQILQQVIQAAPGAGSLQIGIASMRGPAVNFTGRGAGKARGGVTGEVGELSYAIQGNVLSGANVWLDAEVALLSTPGDLSQKLMAAMEAAAAGGGDGRCSCGFDPTGCGSPPPSFKKSAHVGFMILARIGDTDPTCLDGNDCANSVTYMRLNVANRNASTASPDPVLQLRQKYDLWRANHVGRADAILSSVSPVAALPADGVSARTVTVVLRDIEGARLAAGGDDLQVETVDGVPALVELGAVTDRGDGSYSFTVRAGRQAGTDRLALTARSVGGKRITLYPYLDVRTDALEPLHVGFDEVSTAAGAVVPLTVNVPSRPGGRYVVLGSLSGTDPGLPWGRWTIPLNPDALMWTTWRRAGTAGLLPGTIGFLDADGHAEGAVHVGSGALLAMAGLRVDWAAVVVGKGTPVVSNAAGFDVLP